MRKNEIKYEFSDNLVRKDFPIRLKTIRLKAKLTQVEFAEIFGISVSALSYYETGNRIPDIVFLSRLQEYFNVPTDYFLGLSNSIKKEYDNVSEMLRLTDTAIEKMLKFINDYGSIEPNRNNNLEIGITLLNRLLENDDFYAAINLIIYGQIDHKMMVPDDEYIKYLVTRKLSILIDSLYNDCKHYTEEFSALETSFQKYYCEYVSKKFENNSLLQEKEIQDIIEENKRLSELLEEKKKQEGFDTYDLLLQRRNMLINRLKEEGANNGEHNPSEE